MVNKYELLPFSGRPAKYGAPLNERVFSGALANENGCWVWQRALHSGNGYGLIAINGVNTYAHRIAYECAIGPIPTGLVIDHLCRNRACVNPAHLEAVTLAENSTRTRGRLRNREREAQIVKLRADGVTYRKIADITGLSQQRILQIMQRYETDVSDGRMSPVV